VVVIEHSKMVFSG